MRIALYHNAPSGGAKRAIYEWTRRLATKHHIDVYTQSSADHAFCDIRPLVQQHHIFEFKPRKLFGSPWGRLNQLQRWRDLGELAQLGQRIAQKINAGRYDLVFAHTCLYTFIPPCLQFVQVPALYYLHEPFGPKFMRQFQRPYMKDDKWRQVLNRFDPLVGLYQKRLAAMQHKSMRQTKLLLANSHFTQEQMKLAYGVDTPVCHYGVDCDSFRIVPDVRKGDHVISVGELSPRKGFDFIVESLGHIPADQRPKLRLACNSVNTLEKGYIENLAAQHQVDLQVLTNLNTAELAVEYNKAQLCVYAPVLEPFGLVPVEAMSCGTPVVGVREGGVQESIVHNQTGLLVERDPAQFATAVQHLLSNSRLVLEYGRNSREHILRNWTWDASVAQLEKHFLACIEQRDLSKKET
ncbi:MAG: glycosyltransferase family 4 protein [Anaerolineales bacterium]|nr:glycosyltransferase family 4 protein [Anaerolineales bacterium]